MSPVRSRPPEQWNRTPTGRGVGNAADNLGDPVREALEERPPVVQRRGIETATPPRRPELPIGETIERQQRLVMPGGGGALTGPSSSGSRRSTTVRTPYSHAAAQPATVRRSGASLRITDPRRVRPPLIRGGSPPRSRVLKVPSQCRSRAERTIRRRFGPPEPGCLSGERVPPRWSGGRNVELEPPRGRRTGTARRSDSRPRRGDIDIDGAHVALDVLMRHPRTQASTLTGSSLRARPGQARVVAPPEGSHCPTRTARIPLRSRCVGTARQRSARHFHEPPRAKAATAETIMTRCTPRAAASSCINAPPSCAMFIISVFFPSCAVVGISAITLRGGNAFTVHI